MVKKKQKRFCWYIPGGFQGFCTSSSYTLVVTGQDIGALVVYDVDVIHHADQILKVAFGKGGEAFVPCAENQDVEPLDEQADEGDDPVDPDDDCNQDPVDDADEQSVRLASCMYVKSWVRAGFRSFGHNYHHAPLALPLIK